MTSIRIHYDGADIVAGVKGGVGAAAGTGCGVGVDGVRVGSAASSESV